MFARCLSAFLVMIVGAAGVATLSVPHAAAADLASEPVTGKRPLVGGRCSYLNNIWLFGDPTDCPGDETVPACDAPSVVSAARRFAARAEPVYRVPRVTEFVPLREAFDPYPNPSPLVRRYCVASVELSNGDHTTAHYFVEEDSGFVGLSWKVYVCIDGYDPWRVYDGRCRVARPSRQH